MRAASRHLLAVAMGFALLACGFLDPYPEKVGPSPPDGSLLWQYELGGSDDLAIVSHTLSDGIVFAGTYDTNTVYAFDARSGDVIWTFAVEGYLRPPPQVAGGLVLARGEHVYIFDASAGEVLWTSKGLEERIEDPALGEDGTLYYTSANDAGVRFFNAVDPLSGERLWNIEMPETEWPALFPPTQVGGMVYVSHKLIEVHALDNKTGELKWRFSGDGAMNSAPVISNGQAYLLSEHNTAYALDEATGAPVWTRVREATVPYSINDGWFLFPAVVVDTVWYYQDRVDSPDKDGGVVVLHALDTATGRLLWTFDDVDLSNTLSPLAAEDVTFVNGPLGSLYALDAGSGNVLWSSEDDDKNWQLSVAVVVDGVLYTNSIHGFLHTIDARTGEAIWSADINDHVGGYPPPYAISDGVVYVGGNDNDGKDFVFAFAVNPE